MTNTGTARQLSVTLTLAAVGTLAYAGTTAHADPVPTRVAVAETLSAGPSAAPASSAAGRLPPRRRCGCHRGSR